MFLNLIIVNTIVNCNFVFVMYHYSWAIVVCAMIIQCSISLTYLQGHAFRTCREVEIAANGSVMYFLPLQSLEVKLPHVAQRAIIINAPEEESVTIVSSSKAHH